MKKNEGMVHVYCCTIPLYYMCILNSRKHEDCQALFSFLLINTKRTFVSRNAE